MTNIIQQSIALPRKAFVDRSKPQTLLDQLIAKIRELSPESLNTQFQGESLLHVAASHGHVKLVQELLARGANPIIQDSEGCTPLHRAVTGIAERLQNTSFADAHSHALQILRCLITAVEQPLAYTLLKDQNGYTMCERYRALQENVHTIDLTPESLNKVALNIAFYRMLLEDFDFDFSELQGYHDACNLFSLQQRLSQDKL
ncbi:MAG: ankyrin repeat domain-containing protein [Chlamydiia bacterium]|nr:ankyrin repeat domain-containing protein [Chlamydiia bacterium]